MSGRQMSQTAKYQGAKCLEREMSLPPIVWGTYCPGSQISGRQMSQRQLSGADRRAPNVRQPVGTDVLVTSGGRQFSATLVEARQG